LSVRCPARRAAALNQPEITVMSNAQPTITLDEVLLRAERDSRRLGLSISTGRLSAGASHVPFVRLCASDGREVATGFGKGDGLQRQVSAHFEALERFYVSHSVIQQQTVHQLRLLKSTEVGAQAALANEVLISRWADEFPESTAGCVRYQRDDDAVWYPAFLVDPRYPSHTLEGDSFDEYRSLFRYSSGLGTGASTSRAEAAMHAVCELIEHDSLSIALLRWFVLMDHEVRAVRVQSLPHEVAGLLRQGSLVTGAPVRLLDITSDLAIPSYIAISEPSLDQPALVGMGASPIASHAAYRALDELTQLVAFSYLAHADRPVRRLASWPVLQQSAYMHLSRLRPGCITEIDLRPSPPALAPDDALHSLTVDLQRKGFECYLRDLAPSDSQVSVVAALVPGLERFSLVRLGLPVLPNGRGWHLWKQPGRREPQQLLHTGLPHPARRAPTGPKTPQA
jgi:ribosomal protein S12 methylthiotransferase accessory factor